MQVPTRYSIRSFMIFMLLMLSTFIPNGFSSPALAQSSFKNSPNEIPLILEASQLESSAQVGGGLYFSARNAGELSDALASAVEIPANLPTGKLSIKVTAEGDLKDASVRVLDAETGKDAERVRTYTSPNTNPRMLSLPDGTYDVEVTPIGLKGVDKQILTGIEIREGETVEKVVDFSFGQIAITVTRNGLLSDAAVTVYRPGTKDQVTHERTYRSPSSNPKKLKLGPGIYDIEVRSVEIANKPTTRFSDVEVKSGDALEKSVELSSGNLRIGAVTGEKLVDAAVTVIDIQTGMSVVQGRTYTSPNSNPKEFVLTPGTYKVTIKPVRLEGNPSKEIEVQINADETTEYKFDFAN